MSTPTLQEKCLKAAIDQLKSAPTRDKARTVYLTWGVLKDNPEFKNAVVEKQKQFGIRK